MDLETLDLMAEAIFDLHIKVLEKILLQEPFDQIVNSFQKDMTDLNYIEIIKRSGHLSFDDNNKLIGAYPVSPIPTEYEIMVEGVGKGFSMCAVDALGLPYTFMKKVTITTNDKSTGEKLVITLDPESKQQEIHKTFVTYQNTPDELQGDNSAANVQCPAIHFYSNKNDIPEHLQIWEYAEAIKYSHMRFGKTEMVKRVKAVIEAL